MNKLTESSIRKAEILNKQYKIYDGGGMFLLVHPNGSKYWRMKYTFDGKSKLASFGVWPGISLKVARERRYDAKQKIKIGVNPVEEKRQNKHHKLNMSTILENNESKKVKKSENKDTQWFSLLYPHGKMKETKESLQLLKSLIFDSSGMEPRSVLEKQQLNEILSRVFNNRSELSKIIWDYYNSVPILNIAVLFLLLIIVMDFFPAILTTLLYFILTVCATVTFSLWIEKNVKE